MNLTFSIAGVPALNARLDKIATIVAGPIARDALQVGGDIIRGAAEAEVHRLTGALARDIVVVTRVREDGTQKYVLIGPGWIADAYRRVARNRGASGRDAAPDQTTNPGVYGFFLEVGHRAPGKGLAHDQQYRRDARSAKKRGKKVDTGKYGNLTTPAYPWLGPAFDNNSERAMKAVANVIEQRLGELGL